MREIASFESRASSVCCQVKEKIEKISEEVSEFKTFEDEYVPPESLAKVEMLYENLMPYRNQGVNTMKHGWLHGEITDWHELQLMIYERFKEVLKIKNEEKYNKFFQCLCDDCKAARFDMTETEIAAEDLMCLGCKKTFVRKAFLNHLGKSDACKDAYGLLVYVRLCQASRKKSIKKYNDGSKKKREEYYQANKQKILKDCKEKRKE